MEPNPQNQVGVEESQYTNIWLLSAEAVLSQKRNVLNQMGSFTVCCSLFSSDSLSQFGIEVCIALSLCHVTTRQLIFLNDTCALTNHYGSRSCQWSMLRFTLQQENYLKKTKTNQYVQHSVKIMENEFQRCCTSLQSS